MKLSNVRFEQAAAIFQKDFLLGLRRRAAFAAMLMFSLTAIASLSLSTGGAVIEEKLLAALLWVVIFFAASAGISGTFEAEAAAGTLTAALTTSASVKSGLFPILLFPITLPIFLPAIQLTAALIAAIIFFVPPVKGLGDLAKIIFFHVPTA